jgi:hypothetical protein
LVSNLGEHTQHVQKALPGGRAGVDRLLGRHEAGAAPPNVPDDVLQVADASGQAIDTGDYQNVTGMQEFEQGSQLLAAAPL